MALGFTMASAISSVQHPGPFHAVFNEILGGAFHRAADDRPAVGQVLVILHAAPIAVQVGGHAEQCGALGAGQLALGDALVKPLDDLTDAAGQNAERPIQHPEFCFQPALAVEHEGSSWRSRLRRT